MIPKRDYTREGEIVVRGGGGGGRGGSEGGKRLSRLVLPSLRAATETGGRGKPQSSKGSSGDGIDVRAYSL